MASKKEDRNKKSLETLKSRIDKQKIGQVLDEIFDEYFPRPPYPSELESGKSTVNKATVNTDRNTAKTADDLPAKENSTVFLNTTVIPITTVAGDAENEDEKTTVVKKTTVNKRNTVVRRNTVIEETPLVPTSTVVKRNTVEFVFFDELFSSENQYLFSYVVVLHWILDHFIPTAAFRVSQVYLRLFRLGYGIKSNNGVCKVGYSSLVKSCGLSRKHLSFSIRELEEMGAIEILERENKGRQGGGSSYRILVPSEAIDTVVKTTTVVKRNTVEKRNTVVQKTTVVIEEPYIYKDINKSIKTSSMLMTPRNSVFKSDWLHNFIFGFPEHERERIKRLAERFDYFILTGGKKKEWINNPTGTFVSIIKNEINIKLPDYVPTFEERVGEEAIISEKENLEQTRERIELEIRDFLGSISFEAKSVFITQARLRYELNPRENDEDVVDRMVYMLLLEWDRGEDWRQLYREMAGSGVGDTGRNRIRATKLGEGEPI